MWTHKVFIVGSEVRRSDLIFRGTAIGTAGPAYDYVTV